MDSVRGFKSLQGVVRRSLALGLDAPAQKFYFLTNNYFMPSGLRENRYSVTTLNVFPQGACSLVVRGSLPAG